MWRDHLTEIIIAAALFAFVSVMGFVASRWRRADNLAHLDEWGLGGRSFGGWITWFLVGGDLYTAYTFVAVPALLFASGAAGFFAVPYTVIIYPLVFLVLVRMWSVSHRHGFVTPADFVRSRFQSPTLALLIAITGILATMPYIALPVVSALALFLYPHSITGVLASKNRDVIKRNMSALPAYSLLLGLIALLGYAAVAANVTPLKNPNGSNDNNTVVPLLFDKLFPDWFAGIAYAAIGIGALVPAAIMSIAAANLFTRNIYREYLKRDATPGQEAQVSKVASLLVKFGALVFVVFVDPQFSIDLQLIGGVIILQTLPAVALGLFTRWFHRGALIAGWVAGMGLGMWMLYQIPNAATKRAHFGGSAFPLEKFGFDTPKTIYVGFVAGGGNPARAAPP